MIYHFFRIIFYPIRLIIYLIQSNFIRFFNLMDLGATQEPNWKEYIKENINLNHKILDFGCGTGNFSNLFKKDKYLGIDINKNFISYAKQKNPEYNFITVDYIKNNKFVYEKRDVILVNGVLHHISDENINKSFEIIKKISNQNAKILILEPTKPVSIFTLDFIQKILDLGINIKSSLEYEELLKKYINIEKITTYKFSYEIGVVIFGELK